MPKTLRSKPLILGINGSPHDKGTVSTLLNAVLNAAKRAGADVQRLDLYKMKVSHEPGLYSVSPKLEVPKNMPKDDIAAAYPLIMKADGLVLASPCYWANMSGVMKDFIDHLTALENDGFKLQGKVAAFIAASKENEGGVEMAAMSMVTALAQMGVLIIPNGILWYPGKWLTAKKTDKSWAKTDAPLVGKHMVKMIKLLKKHPISWEE
jgi:multimeric flavodoxin WrbA